MTLVKPLFQLSTFADDLSRGSATALQRHYHPGADIRVLYLDRPRETLELIHGWAEIADWLSRSLLTCVGRRVTRLVDSGDHVAFHDERQRPNGRWEVTQNMAEIRDGRIGHQYSIVGWNVDRRTPTVTGGVCPRR